MAFQARLAQVSTVVLRLAAFLFFRFFPAHAPNVVLALFATYVPSFLSTYLSSPELEIVDSKTDVTVEEDVVEPSRPLLTAEGVAVVPEPQVVAEVIQVEETAVLAEKPRSALNILLWGAPDARHRLASITTFLINLFLAALTLDALYRARWLHRAEDLSFVRLGYVSHEQASFLIREPDQLQMPINFELHIKDAQAPFDNPLWQSAGVLQSTTNNTDFTGVVNIPLAHSKQRVYEWRTSNNHSGEFLAPPRPGQMPDYHDGKFTFLSTSCILPRFPYNPLDHPLSIPGLRHLARKLPDLSAQFMLFLGDFIYVDVPALFGESLEEYRMQYRQVYASPDWAPVGQNLSWIHVFDDHEIRNDWSSQQSGIYTTAVEPWHIYQSNVNPPRAVAAGTKSQRGPNATWYEFTQGPASFFMMDTRSYRSSNNEPFDESDKTMLGKEQLADFLAWLARPLPKGVKWRFVASSVPFTKNWPVNRKDTWGGFLVERREILEAMWGAGAKGTGVIILSGDRHEFAATRFPPPVDSQWPQSATVHEFSTSPLNQFASPFPTYKQTDDEDVMMNYIPGGTSKFGSFTIEEIAGKSYMTYHLYIDGEETWTTVVMAPPTPDTASVFGSFMDRIRFS